MGMIASSSGATDPAAWTARELLSNVVFQKLFREVDPRLLGFGAKQQHRNEAPSP